MDALELYLKEVRQLHDSGAAVAETSYYPALAQLLNDIGSKLKPKVRCVVNPANRGAGIPDIGLFTSDQFQKAVDLAPRQGQLPARGVLEAKPPSQNIQEIASSDQVKKYCLKYGTVIVTNLREFLLVSKDENDELIPVEGYQIAPDELSFWSISLHPSKEARAQGERFRDFLMRLLLHSAPLYEPSDLAWFLASYARDAKTAVERSDAPALLELRAALVLEQIHGNPRGFSFPGIIRFSKSARMKGTLMSYWAWIDIPIEAAPPAFGQRTAPYYPSREYSIENCLNQGRPKEMLPLQAAKGEGALVAAEVKKAAMTRVFGFEILPAPFVVSHLQLGLLLRHFLSSG